MDKFHEGQHVSHQLHGYVQVTDVDEARKLVEIRDASGKYHRVHPISLMRLPMAKFEVRIQWVGGAVTLSGPLYQEGVSEYIGRLTDTLYRADSITVERIVPPVTKNS